MKCLACWKEARFLRHFHAAATVVWLFISVIVVSTDLKNSVPFVSFMSAYAIVTGHWGSWQSTRAEEAVVAKE